MHRETLRLWVRQAEVDGGSRNDRLTTEERERMKATELYDAGALASVGSTGDAYDSALAESFVDR